MTLTIARQMIAGEFLKLRRKRGLLAWSLLLTAGVVSVFYGYNAIEHASDPIKYAPAGGTLRFDRAVQVLGVWFASLSAVLIGTEAGASDLASGVFRDLVVTGRSRLALFAVRVPAAIMLSLATAAIGFAIAVAGAFLLADGASTPSLALIGESALWVAVAQIAITTVAVGVASLTGSRPLTLTVLIGWQTVVTSLLLSVSSLGSARDAVLNAALNQLKPGASAGMSVAMAVGIAVVVVLAWMAVWAGLGAWRTRTRDA